MRTLRELAKALDIGPDQLVDWDDGASDGRRPELAALDLVAVLGPRAAPWPPMRAAERLLIELLPSKQVTRVRFPSPAPPPTRCNNVRTRADCGVYPAFQAGHQGSLGLLPDRFAPPARGA